MTREAIELMLEALAEDGKPGNAPSAAAMRT